MDYKDVVMAALLLAATNAWSLVIHELFEQYFPKSHMSLIVSYAVFATLLTIFVVYLSRNKK